MALSTSRDLHYHTLNPSWTVSSNSITKEKTTMQYESLKPVHVTPEYVVSRATEALADQQARRATAEEAVSEDLTEVLGALSAGQKNQVLRFIRSSYGKDADEIRKIAALDAESAKTAAQRADEPLQRVIRVFSNVTDKDVEIAPTSDLFPLL